MARDRKQRGSEKAKPEIVHYYDVDLRPESDGAAIVFQMVMDRDTRRMYAETLVSTIQCPLSNEMIYGFLSRAWSEKTPGALGLLPDALIFNFTGLKAEVAEEIKEICKRAGWKIEIGYTFGMSAHGIERAWRKVHGEFRLLLGYGLRTPEQAQAALGAALQKYNSKLREEEEAEEAAGKKEADLKEGNRKGD